MSSLKDQLRQGLLDSYKHRIDKDCSCAICGKTKVPLAFHVLEAEFNEGVTLSRGFVPMSASRGRIRGSYPLCDSCAPPCRKCNLPIPTERVLDYGHNIGASNGNGICQHIKFGQFFLAITKRIFKLGRFGKRTN